MNHRPQLSLEILGGLAAFPRLTQCCDVWGAVDVCLESATEKPKFGKYINWIVMAKASINWNLPD